MNEFIFVIENFKAGPAVIQAWLDAIAANPQWNGRAVGVITEAVGSLLHNPPEWFLGKRIVIEKYNREGRITISRCLMPSNRTRRGSGDTFDIPF